jgi:hypothetical protein
VASKWSSNAVNTTRIFYNGGNVGIGSTNPEYILQVKDGGRLRLANDNTGVTVIGCDDSVYNTCIILCGSAKANTAGSIFYNGSSTGSHIFNTYEPATGGSERMRIANSGAVGIQTIANAYAITNNHLAAGALSIGNTTQDYGGGTNWNASTAGLMMECLNNTEIAIHDAGNSIHSFMRYTTNGNFRIGRNMGYGVVNTTLTGALTCDNTILYRR